MKAEGSGSRRPRTASASPPAAAVIELDLTDGDTPSRAGALSRAGEFKRSGGPKEIDVNACLADPDGLSIGRTTGPVPSLVVTLVCVIVL